MESKTARENGQKWILTLSLGRKAFGKNCRTDAVMRDVPFGGEPRWLSASVIFLLLSGVLLLTYAPVIKHAYAFMDDYTMLAVRERAAERGWHYDRDNAAMLAAGRPVYMVLINSALLQTHTLQGLRWLRGAGVVGIILLAWLCWGALQHAHWGRIPSLLVVLFLVTMPPWQVYAAWATTSLFPFAGVLTGVAALLSRCAWEAPPFPRRSWLAGGAVVFLYVALTVYQPAAMFFWVFVAIAVFQPRFTVLDMIRGLVWFGLIAGVALALSFVTYRVGVLWHGDVLPVGRTTLVVNPWEKIQWFLREPLVDALNFLFLTPSRTLAYAVVTFLLTGLLFYFRGGVWERIQKVILAVGLVPLSYLPNLLVAENWSSYRTQSALTSLMVLYCFFALWGYCRRPPRVLATAVFVSILGILAFSSTTQATRNLKAGFVKPQRREWDFLRAQLLRLDLARVTKLYVIAARYTDSIAPIHRYDEFGHPSTASMWVPEPAVYFALRDIDPRLTRIPVEVVPAENAGTIPAGEGVIDMRELSGLRRLPNA